MKGTIVPAILLLAIGIVGGTFVSSIAFLPAVDSPYSPGYVLGLGFFAIGMLVLGVVLLLWWVVGQMYE